MNYNLSDEQLRVFTALKNIQMKERVLWFLLCAFGAITAVLILKVGHVLPTTQSDNFILTILDGLLAILLTPLLNHFFPSLKAAIRKRTQKKVSAK